MVVIIDITRLETLHLVSYRVRGNFTARRRELKNSWSAHGSHYRKALHFTERLAGGKSAVSFNSPKSAIDIVRYL